MSPAAVDLVADDPRYKAWSRVGIMTVAGDDLTLCVNLPGQPRPTGFTAGGDGRERVALCRVRPAGG